MAMDSGTANQLPSTGRDTVHFSKRVLIAISVSCFVTNHIQNSKHRDTINRLWFLAVLWSGLGPPGGPSCSCSWWNPKEDLTLPYLTFQPEAGWCSWDGPSPALPPCSPLPREAHPTHRNSLGLVLASQGCCNKAPRTEWFKGAEIHSLTVLEARSRKSRCQPSRALSPSVQWAPESLGVPGFAAASLQSLPLLSLGLLPSMHLYLSSSYKDTSQIGLRVYLTHVWPRHNLHLSYIYKMLFPNKVTHSGARG